MSDGGGDAHSVYSVSSGGESDAAPAPPPYVPLESDPHSARANSPLSIKDSSEDEAANVSENENVSENNENQCVICYSPVNTPPLSCNHLVCSSCLQNINRSSQRNDCPICRSPISAEDYNDIGQYASSEEEKDDDADYVDE